MSPDPPARSPACFSAADDPWIDVRRQGILYDQVGLRALFTTAHTIDDIAWTMAPAVSVLLRIATAIAARITGLDDPHLDSDQWHERRRELLHRKDGFDSDTVNAYFDRHHFQVFDPARPWLQDPLLASQCDHPSGLNSLVFGRPAGNNLAWLSPHHDRNPVPISTGQALQHLLVHHGYGNAGGCTARTTATTAKPRAAAGPLRATVSFHPIGPSLYHTLLMSIPAFTGTQHTTGDACPWEDHTGPPDPDAALPEVTWPGRLLTGRSLHALLLVPEQSGRTVTDAYLTWATVHTPRPAIDPYLVIRTNASAPVEATGKRRLKARRASADRAWWRELEALLLAGDEHQPTRRPQVFDTLNDLPADLRTGVRVRVCGFDQDPKTIQHRWYTALTPPILPWAQENDPLRAERIARCCSTAEAVGAKLTTLANTAWQQATTPGRQDGDQASKQRRPRDSSWTTAARAGYFARAENVFWHLVDTDPQAPPWPAFAHAAATALREVTASMRARHRHAARAVALAVDQLYRPRPDDQKRA
jgi:CRISPR system Cascade subunit CasA